MNWNEVIWLNSFKQYGKSLRINRKLIVALLITICLITPFTNYFIPFIGRVVKKDWIWRYGK